MNNKSGDKINSPRTIKACLNLGIDVKELYKQSFEEFKINNRDLINLSQEMLKFHYEGREKIRINTINNVKKERQKIIKEEEKYRTMKKAKTRYKNSKSLEKSEEDKRRNKMIQDGKKTIELVLKRQRLNIKNILEEQINKDLMLKTHIAKERKIKATEEKNLEDLERKKNEKERKNQLQEQRRQEEILRQIEQNENTRKEMYEKDMKRINDLKEEERQNKINLKNKTELENKRFEERKKDLEKENQKKEERLRQKFLGQQQYEDLFNKQKEKELEEKQKKSKEKDLNAIKRQDELKLKIHRSLEELREKIEIKEKNSENFLIKMNKKKEKK